MFIKIWYQIAIIFILLLIGAFSRYKKFITEATTKDLVNIVVNIFLPCLTFYSIITQLNFYDLQEKWYLPLLGLFSILFGIGIGWITANLLKLKSAKRRTFIYLTGFNNYGYLAIPIVFAFFGGKGLAFLFLHNFGCSFLYWSLGISILSGGGKSKHSFKHILNPSFLALLIALIITLFNANRFVPKIALDITNILGKGTIPLIMLVIGSILGSLKLRHYANRLIYWLVPIRLIIIPVSIYIILLFLGVPELVRKIVFIVSAMPSASTTVVLVSMYGGSKRLASAGVFVVTACSLISIPFLLWLESIFF